MWFQREIREGVLSFRDYIYGPVYNYSNSDPVPIDTDYVCLGSQLIQSNRLENVQDDEIHHHNHHSWNRRHLNCGQLLRRVKSLQNCDDESHFVISVPPHLHRDLGWFVEVQFLQGLLHSDRLVPNHTYYAHNSDVFCFRRRKDVYRHARRNSVFLQF